MATFRVGIDSYCLNPLELSPLEVLEWADKNGADGVQFSELRLPPEQSLDDGLLDEIAQLARERNLYLEWGGGQHLPFDTRNWNRREVRDSNVAAARQARRVGADVVRSCSGGLMRWTDEAPPTEELLDEMVSTLEEVVPAYRDLGVRLAIELHFEFTTFELLRVFERCNAPPGGPLGICLDTMNLLTMLEDPLAGTGRVHPWIVATHMKDGALMLSDDGLVSFPVEPGLGIVDFESILGVLAILPRVPNLSLEDHGGRFDLPIFEPEFLARFPDLYPEEFARLIQLMRFNDRRPPERRVRPLDRADWPEQCEARVRRGIKSLKRIASDCEKLYGGIFGAPPS